MRLRDLADIRRHFAARESPLAWLGTTHLLCRGIESYVPDFQVILTHPAGVGLCRAAHLPYRFLGEIERDGWTGGPLDVLCFEATPSLEGLAARCGWRLLAPPAAVVHQVADKLRLPELLERARATVPVHRNVEASQEADPEALWDALAWERLVLQTADNNLTGRGTHLVVSRSELAGWVERLAGKAFKVTRFVEGRLLTVSACATAWGTYVSRLSAQLVGLPELTSCWAAHSGNESLDGESLPEEHVEAIRRVCRSLGEELTAEGFAGNFGLDLVLSPDGTPYVLEINPRLQSVSSLVHAAEIEAGELPLQAVHILEFRRPSGAVPDPASRAFSTPHSQIVIEHLGADGEPVRRDLAPGVRRLEGGALVHQSPAGDLQGLRGADLLVTPFCARGQTLSSGDRIAVVQRRGPMTDGAGHLLPEVSEAVRALRSEALGAGEAGP